MEKFFARIEDMLVAAAFAEAGEYGPLHEPHMQPRLQKSISIHAV